MTDKEKIKEEIEKQIDYAEDDTRYTESYREGLIAAYQTIKAFIDSLPEESASANLDEAAKEFGIRQGVELKPFAIKFFKAGAEWQKQKDQETIELAEEHAMLAGMEKMKEEMMKNAREADVVVDRIGEVVYLCPHLSEKTGDKAKIIIV